MKLYEVSIYLQQFHLQGRTLLLVPKVIKPISIVNFEGGEFVLKGLIIKKLRNLPPEGDCV